MQHYCLSWATKDSRELGKAPWRRGGGSPAGTGASGWAPPLACCGRRVQPWAACLLLLLARSGIPASFSRNLENQPQILAEQLSRELCLVAFL